MTTPPPGTREKSKNISALGMLWSFVRPYKKRLIVGFFALMVTTSAMVTIPQHVRVMVDDALRQGDLSGVDRAALWLMVTVIIMVIGIWLRTITIRYTGIKVIADIRNDLYRNVLRQDTAFFETRRTGEIISRVVTDVSILRETVSFQIPALARGILLLVSSVAMLFYTSVKLTLILMSVAPAVIAVSYFLGKVWRKYSAQIQERTADISAQVEESVGNLRTVRAFGQEQSELERLEGHVEGALQISWNLVRSVAVFFSFNVFAGFGAIALVMWVGGREVLAGTFTVGEMMAYFLYIAFLGDAFSNISGFWPALQSAAGATERVFELLRAQPVIQNPVKPVDLPVTTNGRSLTLKGVTFAYPSRPDQAALENISLHVDAGQTVAVVGPSGAGKSTLFHLLMRFYDPQKGDIALDGEDVRKIKLSQLRAELAVVAQEAAIFSTTVVENIRYGRPEATQEEVEEAAKVANAEAFIQALPKSYLTPVGEKGVRLSGGQKQRIAIARTVLRDPSVLLLDEATSHLDAESERQVQEAFSHLMQNRTTLVIAHRLATVRAADKIIVLDHGKIIATGNHKELLSSCDLYKRLAELQFLAG